MAQSDWRQLDAQGINKLARHFRKAGDDLAVESLKEAHRSSAEIVLEWALGLVPRRTGTLFSALKAHATVRAGVVKTKSGRTTPYANPIHWGWHKRNIRPTFFLTRAGALSEPEWADEYMKKLEDALTAFESRYNA